LLGSGNSSLLDRALAYDAALGWSIIAVIGKRAAGLWRPFQDRLADEATLRKMFARPGVTGLAVITGQVSGGLAVRDFDDTDAYHAWASANPENAARLPTVQTSRGYHVYGRLDAEQYLTFDDGELRADSRHYVLLPPSQHPDGAVYTWVNPLPLDGGPLPLLPQSLVEGQPRQPTDNPRTTQDNPLQPIACAQANLTNLIGSTLPPGPGHRNRCLFRLARSLKGIMLDATPDQLRAIVQDWHRQALPHIGTKDFGTSWADFIFAWGAIKHPGGMSFNAATETAEGIVLEGVAASYDGHLRRLAALCAALQAQRGEGPFFLGCREAGEYLGIGKTQAWRLLRALMFDGVLELVENGIKACGSAPGKATEWRFINPE